MKSYPTKFKSFQWKIVQMGAFQKSQNSIQTLIIDQFRYIKIHSQTIDLRARLWGIKPTNSVVIPQSLVLRSIV